ncbi:hypothetical protein Q9233_017726 [Columba guinea]|nr:hypothetical protein Q9233_017726 [Columba guinea]
MPKKRQALVEFEDILGACNAVNYAADNQIYIAGHPAFVNYSTSQKISRPGDADDSRGVNNVLLFTILNPIYSITTDVLYTICNPCGPVQRIVIFRKNGRAGHALRDVRLGAERPQRAKASLNGADIYSGCCTLKIEYAKVLTPQIPPALNVFKNDQDTWDYTNPNLSGQGDPGGNPNKRQRQPPLLGDHPAEYGTHHGGARHGGARHGGARHGGARHGGARHGGHDMGEAPTAGTTATTTTRATGPPLPTMKGAGWAPRSGGTAGGGPGRYGPQYGHPPPPPPPPEYGPHADSPVLMVYGLDQAKMNCDRVFNIFCLYGNVEKVRAQRVEFTEVKFVEVKFIEVKFMEESGGVLTSSWPIGGQVHGGERSSSGLLEWDSKSDALETLGFLNHYQMKNPNGPYPYTLKLCFSTAQHAS